MKLLDSTLAGIARDHLGIPTLETRRSDRLDFHDVAIWGVRDALNAAYDAGARSAGHRAAELVVVLEYVRATLKLRHLDEASDDEVEEALRMADAAMAGAPSVSLPSTAPDLALPARFDDYEISPCRRYEEPDSPGRFTFEPCEPREADVWTLYGHVTGEGVQAIGDFDTREHAEEVFARISGRRYTDESTNGRR